MASEGLGLIKIHTYPPKRAKSKSSANGQPTWINKRVVVISMVVA